MNIVNAPMNFSLSNRAEMAATAPIKASGRQGMATYLRGGMLALVATLALPVVAQVESKVQSKESPFGIDIVDKVNLAGSDEASAIFQKEVLPSITKLINTNLSESSKFSQSGSFSLDPAKLRLAVESTARVYFVGEGAGFRNTLGFNTLEAGAEASSDQITKTAQLIFPDASSSVSTYDPSEKAKRTSSSPLLPGDFVDLGKFEAGTALDFFLIANGAAGGKDVWTASASRNWDGLDHLVAFALPSSPYLILAFEDMIKGGDNDYNDVIFAVDIGAINVQRLLSTPEPATWALLLGLGGVAIFWRRRMQAA